MAVLPIRKFPDPVLREKTLPVEKIDDELHKLIKNMADTMYAAPGVGLAANQVGILKSVVVVDIDEGLMVFLNPEITWYGNETEEGEEGCLSVYPQEIQVMIPRSTKIRFKAKNEKGEPVEFEAEGLLARALQHEVDHIHGILILDRTSPEERRRALKDLAGKTLV
ncbi:MAG: peptide deformylase [Candidatus Aquicultor secundus]|uniref:Peptide deformylase n=1 Tax=Candidatus Aquicultor secundus TaxID=1973895 RepID=A0A2M7T9W0_9ACTN|nr:peptide deformylase [Candidatus Aquicultor secundus]NCO65232.1 peptide deformylase [Solirubrobacter sp.]OIO86383.1 MAG: peptide deformylase [Candidatus Aquicultor secundus]PIU26815.1 MAG: peptide deformylase [Candidatus Aquicultor secundus]PIW21255.1 MAG: peptide deformylase [Candidatus Aquicultor secundus]PIX52452.1 MAG: peptide deformylase [Candidatus Aquicultor secundus]